MKRDIEAGDSGDSGDVSTGADDPIPVGGFLLTAALENGQEVSRPWTSLLPGKMVHVLEDQPLVLSLTIQNTTSDLLQFGTARGHDREFHLDVRGGPIIRKQVGKEMISLHEETLNQKPPYTAYSKAFYGFPSSGAMVLFGSRQLYEIEPGESLNFRVLVDQIYDLSTGGLFRVSVHHLFPVYQREQDGQAWAEYVGSILHREIRPGRSEEGISNALYVLVDRRAVSEVRQ